jgi:hypothetical protein
MQWRCSDVLGEWSAKNTPPIPFPRLPEFAIRSNFHPLKREMDYAGKAKALRPMGSRSSST